MLDQTLVWNTDNALQVTSLTARLRGLAALGPGNRILVSDLWGSDERGAMIIAAHHWALEGETLSFEAPILEAPHRFELQPLVDPSGSIIGVAGRAVELHAAAGPLDPQALALGERTAGMGTWHEDLLTGTVTISDGLAALLGIPRHVANLDLPAFDHPDDRERAAATRAAAGSDSYVCDHRILCVGSRVRSVRERARTFLDDRGIPVARVGTLIDISDFKEREAELTELALHDPLTGLPNRASLHERLNATVARCERNDLRCAVLFIDLDNFKAVNDERGHQFGDRVLRSVADRLVRNVRASDLVARLGGDEFVVIVEDLLSEAAALDAARKLLRNLEEAFMVEGHFVSLSASVGIAVYPRDGASGEELLQRADQEMYVVKHNGGRGVKLACHPSSPDRPHYGILENVLYYALLVGFAGQTFGFVLFLPVVILTRASAPLATA